jgi:hypothetical protein
MDDSCIIQTVMGGCFRGRKPVGKHRGRKKSAVWRNATDLLQTLNWNVAARSGEGCRKVIQAGHSTKTGQSGVRALLSLLEINIQTKALV